MYRFVASCIRHRIVYRSIPIVYRSIPRVFRSIPRVLIPVASGSKYCRSHGRLFPRCVFGGLLGLSIQAKSTDEAKSSAKSKSSAKAKSSADELKEVKEEADKLFDESKFPELLAFLTQQESWYDEHELLWRVARCKYHLSKKDSKKKDQLLRDSLSHVERALQIDNKCGPAHKWAAIVLDAASALDGTRARIEQTLNVRRHMEEAIKLMPTDATSYYLLGEWHFSVAMTSWMEKKIASVIFATLPDADLEQALLLFQTAELIEPGFYSRNLLLMAKTLLSLNRDKEIAKESLSQLVHRYKHSDKWDDVEAVTEAKSLLAKMGVKV